MKSELDVSVYYDVHTPDLNTIKMVLSCVCLTFSFHLFLKCTIRALTMHCILNCILLLLIEVLMHLSQWVISLCVLYLEASVLLHIISSNILFLWPTCGAWKIQEIG